MKCLIVHNEIFNWTNAMMVYVNAKLHMRKLDEAKPLRILKPRFHFWWCCNWYKGSCNIWLVMKTRKTQGIILNCLKQDGLAMQTEHGYNFSKTTLTIRSSGPRLNMPLFLMVLQSILRNFSFLRHFLLFWNTWVTSIVN